MDEALNNFSDFKAELQESSTEIAQELKAYDLDDALVSRSYELSVKIQNLQNNHFLFLQKRELERNAHTRQIN